MSIEDARLISNSLERGQAVIRPSLPCADAPPLSYAEFEKVMTRIRAEAGRLHLNLDAMTLTGEDSR